MKPEIAKNWEAALKAFNAAKTAFNNDEADVEVLKKLHMAIFYGQSAIRIFNKSEGDVAAGTFRTKFEEINNLGTIQAIDMTFKALEEYHNLIPKEYNLPAPISD